MVKTDISNIFIIVCTVLQIFVFQCVFAVCRNLMPANLSRTQALYAERKRTWSTLFAHAFSRCGIPQSPDIVAILLGYYRGIIAIRP